MIKKFKVERFKSIESVELDLGNVNVFIGANGSGKSNLLEALAVMAAAASGRVDQESLLRRGCRPKGFPKPMFQDIPEDTKTLVEAGNNRQSYSVDLLSPSQGRWIGWEFQQEVVSVAGAELLNRANARIGAKGDPQAGIAALMLAEGVFSEQAADFLKTLAAYSIFSADNLIMRGQVQDLQIREPVGLSGGRLIEAVGEIFDDPRLVEKLAGELSSSFEFIDKTGVFFREEPSEENKKSRFLGFSDRYFRPHRTGLPWILGADQVNEGALYFLFASVLCLHPSAPSLFAIDNADHGLNPLLAKRMMSTICKWILEPEGKRQILMTTHNPLVLDGLPLEDDRVRLFTVDRDNLGKTVVKRFMVTKDHLQKAAEGWTLSRMWVNGLIGGVPNV